jgi:hypothetical protein
MEIRSALEALDLTEVPDLKVLREQFRWLSRFYHPDNRATGDIDEFIKVKKSYDFIKKHYVKEW